MKNAYVVSCEETREAVLIDPGDEVDGLLEAIDEHALQVRHILLTHAHLDHITGVAEAKAARGVETWLHRADDPLYRAVVQQGLMFGLRVSAQPPVDRFYEDHQRITVGGLQIAVHPTPGHSPGGVCLEIRDGEGLELFVGDTLFAGSIGRTDLPGGDYDTLIQSIRRVLFAYADPTPVHSGHGPDTTVGDERKSNPFLRS